MSLMFYELARQQMKMAVIDIRGRFFAAIGVDPLIDFRDSDNPVVNELRAAINAVEDLADSTLYSLDDVEAPSVQSVLDFNDFMCRCDGVVRNYVNQLNDILTKDKKVAERVKYLQDIRNKHNQPSDNKNPDDVTKKINGSVNNLNGAETVSLDKDGNINPEDKK